MITTTLKDLRVPGVGTYDTLLDSLSKIHTDDEPLPLEYIFNTYGFDVALWALRAMGSRYEGAVTLYTCCCARQALEGFAEAPLEAEALRVAIETAERPFREVLSSRANWGNWDDATKEFLRLCRLEGEYGEVV